MTRGNGTNLTTRVEGFPLNHVGGSARGVDVGGGSGGGVGEGLRRRGGGWKGGN